MTSLRQKLIDYIKSHGQVHFRDIEKYAEDNNYKVYTATRRLQEARNPKDLKNYDPDIHIIDEDGKIDGDGTIKWYIYKPFFADHLTDPDVIEKAIQASNQAQRDLIKLPAEQRAIKEGTPRINDSVPSQPKPEVVVDWSKRVRHPRGWSYYPPAPPKACCPIFKASQGRMHAQGCKTQKQIHS